MRTRRGFCYPNTTLTMATRNHQDLSSSSSKRLRVPHHPPDSFDALPDDLVLCILSRLASSASRPADLVGVLLTCKRLKGLGVNPTVLSKASSNTFAVPARRWSEEAHRFFKLCADAGNLEACYTLGMIRFYCLQNRGSGASLMAKAAIGSHAAALYSLAIIQFNGSGGSKTDKDLRAGVALCTRATFLGHVHAMRELGHCLQDGYGVRQNIAEGRRFLVQANARELAAALLSAPSLGPIERAALAGRCPLLSDFGCDVPVVETHQANQFLVEWFGSGRAGTQAPRLCSHVGCGRPESRKHEFRRCSVCGTANYCSRACQALHWKIQHKAECTPIERLVEEDGGDGVNDGVRAEAGGDVLMADS